jgi:hypothetical protein
MRYEIKKITKMIDEVTNYFLYNFECETKIHVFSEEDAHVIKFFFHGVQLDGKEQKRLRNIMQPGRDPSLTNYYWQLTGEIESDNELSLVAMMCDEVTMEQLKEGFSLVMTRKRIDAKSK